MVNTVSLEDLKISARFCSEFLAQARSALARSRRPPAHRGAMAGEPGRTAPSLPQVSAKTSRRTRKCAKWRTRRTRRGRARAGPPTCDRRAAAAGGETRPDALTPSSFLLMPLLPDPFAFTPSSFSLIVAGGAFGTSGARPCRAGGGAAPVVHMRTREAAEALAVCAGTAKLCKCHKQTSPSQANIAMTSKRADGARPRRAGGACTSAARAASSSSATGSTTRRVPP